jgi:hypothetical protein
MPSDESPILKSPLNPEETESPAKPKLEKPETHASLPYQAGIHPGWVDVTGIIPEGVHVDANITEGHPGYEVSGDSEIISQERFAAGKNPSESAEN